jgi:hypothetical protein
VALAVVGVLGLAVAWTAAGSDAPGSGTTTAAAPTVTAPVGAASTTGGTGTAEGTTPPPVRSLPDIEIGWAGDAVPASSDLGLPADPSILFGGVAETLHAPDVMFVNLEGTLTSGGASKCGAGSTNCFAFRSPPRYAGAIAAAGIDVLNQANNHAFDFGASGRADTVAALRRHGLAHTGGPGEIAVVRRHGVRVAFVGFASYTWSAPLNDPAGVARLVRAAGRRADLVVVAVHGGAEGAGAGHVPYGHESYLGEDRGDLRRFARTAIDAGADLVVGSGPHVVRGMEFYRGRLIAYSVGNFVGYGHVFALVGPTTISCVLRVTLHGDGTFATGRIVATLLTGDGVAARDPAGRAITMIRALSRADFGSRRARVDGSGRIRAPS